jgi:hypothetical protein
MEVHDEGLSTRDIASGGGAAAERDQEERTPQGDAPVETDVAPATADTTGAVEPAPADIAADTDADTGDGAGTLLSQDAQQELRSSWEGIQTQFVDDPRRAVEDADSLVASAMQRLADGFAAERERLEGMWARGEDVGTEDLRVALQRYRSFFNRLLSA